MKTVDSIEQEIGKLTIERVADPAGFYAGHADELAATGADAFEQPVAAFGPQVAERFCRASLAQVMRYGERIAGFALYEMLRGGHWRPAVN